MPKTYRVLFLLLCLYFVQDNAECQGWERLHPVTTSSTLTSIFFADSLTGFAVGTSGTILKTNNAGRFWSQPDTVTSNNLNSVYFINSQTGYVAGDSGTILKTIDSGEHWLAQNSNTLNNLTGVFFTSETNGIAIGEKGTIIKTNDGGTTWVWHGMSSDINLSKIFLTDSQTGFVIGSKSYGYTIYKTIDGGLNWNGLVVVSSSTGYFYSLNFPTHDTGYIGGIEGNIFKTTDGGGTWVAQSCGVSEFIESLSFVDANTGYGTGGANLTLGFVIKTVDGGKTWTRTTPNDVFNQQELRDIFFTNKNTGFVISREANISKSIDGGYTWNETTLRGRCLFNTVVFIDSTNGFIGTGSDKIMGTSDGGDNWEIFNTGTTGEAFNFSSTSIKKICFLSNKMGYAIGESGLFYKTNDRGQSWHCDTMLTASYSESLTSMSFPDTSTGYILVTRQYYPSGFGSFILKTIDGGTTWSKMPFSPIYGLYSILFLTKQTGFVTGVNGTIFKTIDGGVNWMLIPTSTTSNLYAISFPSNNTGFVAGSKGLILKSSNGGYTWTDQSSLPTMDFYDLFFLDPSYGFIVGNQGAILKTIDGGNTWTTQESGNNGYLRSIWFTSKKIGYICGYECFPSGGYAICDGIILKTTNGGNVGVSNNNRSEFLEVKIYPNPSENELTLSIYTPQQINFSADLYQITGQWIETLFNKELFTGTHLSQIKRNDLPAGVYILSVKTDKEIHSLKIIFL